MFSIESMETSAVAALVKYFNTASIVVAAFFAVLGTVVILRGKSRVEFFRNGALFSVFCVAALAAFALEAVFFNYPHYLKYFAGPELEIRGASPENPNVILTSDSAPAELVTEKDETTGASSAGIVFKKLDRNVTSIFVDVEFDKNEKREMTVSWADGLTNTNSFTKKLHLRVPHDGYTPLQPYGKVSELKVMFTASGADSGVVKVKQVALNKQIPYYFSGLRLIVVSFLLFALYCLLRKGPRAKAAYWLFEYKFNPADWKQNAVHALSVVLLIFFAYMCVNTSYSKLYLSNPVHQQYNKYLVDALANGRTWLEFGTPENLLKAERPYDNAYRIANGYKFNADVMWDWVWYKGKFYCYFGVVPAVILYLPYKLVTGKYLSNNGGIFIFTSIIIILMALLWRFCVKKYMPKAGFAFYMLSFLTLFFASGIFAQMRFTRVYSIVQTAGLMFALAGCLLLLKSVENEKVHRLKLFFACLCLALVVGCRPNMIFASLLVPVVLWKYRSWKLLAFIAIPYVMVAIPLCAYNYVRFDSIFEFGPRYSLTGYNAFSIGLANPFAMVVKVYYGIVSYLFALNKYFLYFPFVECHSPSSNRIMLGFFNNLGIGGGMVNFPIVFCLLYLFKNNLNKRVEYTASRNITLYRLLLSFIIIAAVIAIVDSAVVGFEGRYSLDFAFFIILPSLFCAYYWCEGSNPQNKNRLGIALALLAVSVFIGAFLCVSGGFLIGTDMQVEYNPVLYRYLEHSFGSFRSV